MSQFAHQRLSFENLKTQPLSERPSKVNVQHFARPYSPGSGLKAFIENLPDILAGHDFRKLLHALFEARQKQKPIIWGFGGHVIKCGLAPLLIDLMQRGFVTALATNGSGAIHDLEVALAGSTSEDVSAALPEGQFGVAQETGQYMNEAARIAASRDLGLGEALGFLLAEQLQPRHAGHSLLIAAYKARIPFTVHVAIGTDVTHIHPSLDPAALGLATYRDFQLFCGLVKELNDGGVYLNLGSAVVLPEVFLKAVSVVRNLGFPLKNFTTANFDFLQHYRPRVNVVQRPHVGAGGQGFYFTGHHELMIPLLAAALIEEVEP